MSICFRCILALGASATLLVTAPAIALAPFFEPAVAQGQIDVQLRPTETVATNTPTLVTFGVPFPRGSISVAGLATLTVKQGGIEIPAHVEQLTPWRHRSNAAIDGQSVRVALVQITHSFAAAYPAGETIQLSWGGAARALNVPLLLDPHSAWHAVTSGSFLASASANPMYTPYCRRIGSVAAP